MTGEELRTLAERINVARRVQLQRAGLMTADGKLKNGAGVHRPEQLTTIETTRAVHGSERMYKLKCRCDTCRTSHNARRWARMKAQRARLKLAAAA